MPQPDAPTARAADPGTAAPTRESFLDLVRAGALVRVVLWHALGAAVISYVAAMPLMFFVGGTLAASSVDRTRALPFLRRRLRRLLLPLWAYAAVAVALMVVVALVAPSASTSLHLAGLPAWLLPLWDPPGATWAIAWWAPLWYLRAFIWLLLLTPLLRRVGRGWGLRGPVLAGFVTVALGVAGAAGVPVPTAVRELALYGTFWLLGFAHRDGELAGVDRRARLAIAAVAGVTAVGIGVLHPPAGGIVNASPTLHLAAGCAWLFLVLAFEPELGRIGASGRVAAVVAVLSGRAVTIYLWHAPALWVAHELTDTGGHRWLVLPVAAAVLAVACVCFGWIEDVAARRPPALWPAPVRGSAGRWLLPVPIAALGTVGVVALALLAVPHQDGPTVEEAGYVPSSGMGIELNVARASVAPDVGTVATEATAAPEVVALDDVLVGWAEARGVRGALVDVRRSDGTGWIGTYGIDPDDDDVLSTTREIPVHSITKSFVAAVVLQLAREGTIDLDAPIARWVPAFAHADEITARQLLGHTSGLADSVGKAPADALAEAAAAPLVTPPGTKVAYADVNYYLLGLVVEAATDDDFTAQLHRRVIDPLGLRHTWMDDERSPGDANRHPNAPDRVYRGDRWTTGGIVSTIDDVSRFGLAMWGPASLVGADLRQQMLTLEPETMLGPGTWGFCPCTDRPGAVRLPAAVGYLSHNGRVAYDAGDDLVVAIYTDDEISNTVFQAWSDLDTELRAAARGRPLPSLDADATSGADAPLLDAVEPVEPAPPLDASPEPAS